MNRDEILRCFPELMQIKDESLRGVCVKTWLLAIEESGVSDQEFIETLCHKSLRDCPVTLVRHTRGVIKLAVRIAEQLIEDFSEYIPLDLDMVIAAACLHDVGKIYEHMRDHDGNLTWAAANLHHPITGAAVALKTGCPPEVVYTIANHSHEGAKAKDIPLLFIIRTADEAYYEYLFFGFEKKAKAGW